MNASILCFGEVLLRLSAPGKQLLLQGGGLEAHVGGAEANVAVALSRWGHTAAVATTLPDNALGRGCRDELRRHGLDTNAIRFGGGRMGLYFLTHGAGPRPAEVLYDRAASAFADAPADSHDWKQLLPGVRWLHVSGITPAVSALAAQAALAAMQTARASGAQVSFDCNFRAKLWGGRETEAAAVLHGLCAQANLIFGDDRDIALMLGRAFDGEAGGRQRAAAQLAFETFPSLQWLASTQRTHEAGSQELVGTLHTRTQRVKSCRHLLSDIVDRIGAGDAFAAGILHGLLNGMEPQATVEFGAAAGALKHTVPGDFNLVSVEDVERLVAGAGTDVRR